MNNKKMKAPEHVEQVVLFEWARLQAAKYPMLKTMFAIPNGGKRGSATAAKLKAEGVKAGVCDVCCKRMLWTVYRNETHRRWARFGQTKNIYQRRSGGRVCRRGLQGI